MRPGGWRVLRIPLWKPRDRRGAKSDKHLSGIVGIALKVAPEPIGAVGHGQAVIGKREMVDSDFRVVIP